ncbi:type II toxin-antitoxin system toxin DNA ADP-ribosyl transferase DarT [Flavobacterium polysaccharolyticum]|uniref:DUF4433 domain-containing protein n=1 Tax=Flavobacterium polysaccharolyticum TaxID=3133148 RepID=A0ABU9NNY4_9FLAO
MAVPEKIYFYRMVHWQNVEYILQNGLCCRDHVTADPDYINIGHLQLISDRHDHPIALPNAGSLGDYVPFYFAGHSPMLYLIKNGYQGVTKRPQEDIVYLVCKFETIENSGLEYVFTDRNAKISIANFYTNKQDFEKLHWEVINSKHWNNDESNWSRQDYKQAEFLIKNHVPVQYINAIVVKNEERKIYFEELLTKLALDIKVLIDVNSKLYY